MAETKKETKAVKVDERTAILNEVKKTGKCPKCGAKLISGKICKQHGVFV